MSSGSQLLVVATATVLDVLGSDVVLPRQHNLVIMGEPTCVEVGVPVIDGVLRVRHAQNVQVFLDGCGSDRGVGKNGDVNIVSKGCVEVTNVSRWVAVCQFCIETDVVLVTVHPTVPWSERHFDSLVRVEGLGRTGSRCVSHCLGGFVEDVHVEDIITSKHTVCRLESPVVGV